MCAPVSKYHICIIPLDVDIWGVSSTNGSLVPVAIEARGRGLTKWKLEKQNIYIRGYL